MGVEINLKLRFFVLFVLLLSSLLITTITVKPVRADGTITINVDGSIAPPTASISSLDNVTYTLTSDIKGSIEVQRDNIIVNGANYTIQGIDRYSGWDIDLSYRRNVTVENLNVEAVCFGIYILNSSYCNVSGNSFADTGRGIMVAFSSNNIIVGNTFDRDGLWAEYSYNNSVENNIVNGKPLVYLEGVSNFHVGNAGQVILVKCSNITVENLNLSETSGMELFETHACVISSNNMDNNFINPGIELEFSSDNIITGNNITRNGANMLTDSDNNSIIGNNIASNGDGLLLCNASDNIIAGNNFTANVYVALGISSGLFANVVYHNNFIINSSAQVGVCNTRNVWDDGYPDGGNYWSIYNGTDLYRGQYQNVTGRDRIGDTPYIIDANNTDRYPLMMMYGSTSYISTAGGGRNYVC